LVFFTQGRSFAAIGAAMFASLAFIAVVPDFGTALFDPGSGDYGSRMGFIALACLAGAGIGALGRGLRAAVGQFENEPLVTEPDHPGRPFGRWLVAWIVSGFLCGRIIAAFTVQSREVWLTVEACSTAAMLLVGLLAFRPASRSASLAAIIDCFLVSVLCAGISGLCIIVAGKITWPIFADAVRSSDAQWWKTLKVFIGLATGAGALLGVICWAVGMVRTSKARHHGEPAPVLR
jgi:hypothetical protein